MIIQMLEHTACHHNDNNNVCNKCHRLQLTDVKPFALTAYTLNTVKALLMVHLICKLTPFLHALWVNTLVPILV